MIRPLLLVEDNAQDEFFIVKALTDLAWECLWEVARDGEAAIERLLTGPGAASRILPCAVFLDVMLPRVNGLEVLRQIRQNSRTRLLPVIMFSSSAEPKDLSACYQSGANAYVQKSSDIQQFQQKVQSLATFWVMNNTPP